MCEFQHGTIECRGDGFCWDADADGYDPADHSMPCPACNTKGWLEQRKEEAETCISFSGIYSGTGVDIWESAVKVARRENPEGVDALLLEIGVVNALFEDGNGETQTKTYSYPGPGMAVLADSLLNQMPSAVPFIFDVGPSYNECVIAPSGSGMSFFSNVVQESK